MILFLSIFFVLYGLLHFYAYTKIRHAFQPGPYGEILLAVGMGIMVAAPLLVRLAEYHLPDGPARLSGFMAYVWMGLIFLFVCSVFALDIVRLLLQFLAGMVSAGWVITPKMTFWIPFLFTLSAGVYGVFEARHIRTREIVVETSRIPSATGTFRIAQISDVHLGLIVRGGRMERIVRALERTNPDMIVSTGDLVDGRMKSLEGLDKILGRLKPPCGKFAVTGNHEFYSGIDQALVFTGQSGFTILRNASLPVSGWLAVVGVDDPAGPGYGKKGNNDGTAGLLSKISRKRFVLFLKHRPSIDQGSTGLFDLQLSGHVHGGQIFPFRLVTRLFNPFVYGYFSLAGGSSLYVSRGSGTWGPPIRFLAPPEITVITLVHKEG